MPHVPLRERSFDTACSLAGRAARLLGTRLTRPVVIVGTGRCGTTLLVRILNSHAQLSGFPGEANELWHPALEPFESASLDVPPIEVDPKRFTEVSTANWPPYHGQRVRDVFTGFHMVTGPSRVFFTKSAMISFMIPKIVELFPDARIMHIYRFGPSVVESYFQKNFGKYSRYVFTETDYRACCARYWNDCIVEIEARKRELSLEPRGQLLEFSYESLCQSPREVLDAIARFVGVAPAGFRFDLARISSQNYKVAAHDSDPAHAELLRVMAPGMKLTGYATDGGATSSGEPSEA